MKRYFFHVNEAVEFILNCLPLITEGEIFVPKMNSYSIQDLADKTSKKQKIIGLRQGEKIKEILITKDEKSMAMEKKNMWIIRPYANS
jgi:FlaA1/EpsC-like NDP-sugar epimerase